METLKNKNLRLIGTGGGINEEDLPHIIYKSLGVQGKVNRNIDTAYIKRHITYAKRLYHPMWTAKLLVIADRKPFPPRKKPNMVFIDAVSGYRGLFSSIPVMNEITLEHGEAAMAQITKQQAKDTYIPDIQQNQINRSYVLKKPRYQLEELFLAYLPLWKVEVDSRILKERFIINANTGESEEYLSKLWRSGKWLL
ncbi:hypothetical protein [Halobacillus sp. A5]|uniref:hypothetical protein n=1 Tax=Halobacillus sp. A5 TaxID=2880263 RepID=UPI0020A64C70|nr:hypothetical protein [Halobacillus sp. A5]MCP3027144.1 hypothetical protein [Halobacillus sp. A5]